MAIELNGINNNLNPRVRGGDQGSAKDSAAASTKTTEAPVSAEDRVQLSTHAQNLYRAESDESIDNNKVAALRQQIEEGNYKIDYQKLAGKLMDLESKL